MTAADIIALVERHPEGITSHQAVKISGAPNIGSVLCRLYYYGKIERRTVDRNTRQMLWLPKAKTP